MSSIRFLKLRPHLLTRSTLGLSCKSFVGFPRKWGSLRPGCPAGVAPLGRGWGRVPRSKPLGHGRKVRQQPVAGASLSPSRRLCWVTAVCRGLRWVQWGDKSKPNSSLTGPSFHGETGSSNWKRGGCDSCPSKGEGSSLGRETKSSPSWALAGTHALEVSTAPRSDRGVNRGQSQDPQESSRGH